MCDNLQNLFWRVMFRVPESGPKVMLRAETAMLGMKHCIWREKIMFIRQIKNLEESSLAKAIYNEQKAQGWPGLVEEVTTICEQIGIIFKITNFFIK